MPAVVADNPALWPSEYGSMVTTIYGIGTADGFNERGLAGHMLYLTATDFGVSDAARPGVQAGLWLPIGRRSILEYGATILS